MVEKTKIPRRKYVRRSWILYGLSDKDTIKAQKEVDKVFSSYSFYPEVEWNDFKIFPPEGHQVLGAWRHVQAKGFAFLVDNPKMSKGKRENQLLIYIIGEVSEFSIIEPQLMVLKELFGLEEEIAKSDKNFEQRLDKIQKSKSLTVMTSILGIYTAIINAFALYLRQLTPPTSWSAALVNILNLFIILIHVSALILLFLFIIIMGAYLVKYGMILLKRM